jgi:hypothetical protein
MPPVFVNLEGKEVVDTILEVGIMTLKRLLKRQTDDALQGVDN